MNGKGTVGWKYKINDFQNQILESRKTNRFFEIEASEESESIASALEISEKEYFSKSAQPDTNKGVLPAPWLSEAYFNVWEYVKDKMMYKPSCDYKNKMSQISSKNSIIMTGGLTEE